jgi:hypothetical protein
VSTDEGVRPDNGGRREGSRCEAGPFSAAD